LVNDPFSFGSFVVPHNSSRGCTASILGADVFPSSSLQVGPRKLDCRREVPPARAILRWSSEPSGTREPAMVHWNSWPLAPSPGFASARSRAMDTISTCPDPQLLQAFLQRQLAGPDAHRVARHLEGCSTCVARLRHLSNVSDTTNPTLRGTHAISGPGINT